MHVALCIVVSFHLSGFVSKYRVERGDPACKALCLISDPARSSRDSATEDVFARTFISSLSPTLTVRSDFSTR